jgi:stage II sporulation protein AA (anti-sigma F factor antagonist)
MERNGPEVIAYLAGELDHHSAEELRRRLDQALDNDEVKHMMLDMRAVTFMDSSGIGVVIGRYKKIRARGGSIRVKNVTGKVDRIFAMSGLYKVVEKC